MITIRSLVSRLFIFCGLLLGVALHLATAEPIGTLLSECGQPAPEVCHWGDSCGSGNCIQISCFASDCPSGAGCADITSCWVCR